MTIEITKPEVEALINERLQSGAFKDAEDVILQALRTSPSRVLGMIEGDNDRSSRHKTLQGMFESIRGLADDLDFSRNPSTGRPVDLS